MKTSKRNLVFGLIPLVSMIFLFLSCKEESNPVTPPVEGPSFEMNVTFAPIEVKSTDGKVNLLYSVQTEDFETSGYKLKDFQVLNSAINGMLCSIKDTITNLLITKENISAEDYPLREYSNFRMSVGLVLDPSQVPQKIKHKLILVKDGKEITIEGAETLVSQQQVTVISTPLKGERFIAGNSTTILNNIHPAFQLIYKGITRVPERFCVDWNKIDNTGNYFNGDYQICENWFIYGEQVYAVADGQVVSIKDGMPDQSPVFTQPIPTTLFDGEGNSVVIHINGGYVVYGHLIPNSITVKPGQIVKDGDVIGKVGNSGDSDAPHLHFGLHTDFPYYISEGLPYYINTLEKTGSTGKMFDPYIKLVMPETHLNELVENWGVYNFK
ncbi:MAG: M23 family metallopeptidase [Ignavibacteriaceae bacterium]|jgi:hypothetical protein